MSSDRRQILVKMAVEVAAGAARLPEGAARETYLNERRGEILDHLLAAGTGIERATSAAATVISIARETLKELLRATPEEASPLVELVPRNGRQPLN